MPRPGYTLAALIAAAPAALAQAPVPPAGTPTGRLPTPGAGAPPAPAPQVDPALMAHLNGWEKVMKGATNFYTECSLKRTNLLLKKESEYTGSIMCMKPNLARLRIERKPAAGQKPNPNDYTAYICTGQAVYEYDGSAQQVNEVKLPNGGVGDNLLLEFMSGNLTAAQAVQRFAVKPLKPEDQHYIYLDIRPLTPKDKGEFESMILVLFQPTVPGMGYLPRTVVIRKPNGQEEEVWDFPRPAVNVPKGIGPAIFQFEKPPDGWKFQPDTRQPAGAAPGAPRVARPMGP